MGTLKILKTSQHLHRKKKFFSWWSCRKANAVDKIKSKVGHEGNYTFLFPHTTLRVIFFQFDSERANVLWNKYLFNLGTIAQYFSASCIGFGNWLYNVNVVAYLTKCDWQFGSLVSVNLVVFVAVLNFCFFSLMLIWTFEGIISSNFFKNQ